MAQPKHGRGASARGGGEGQTGRRGGRRRTVLNIGIPFIRVDDFVNQSEDAVALGYRVLEQTIEEIKEGYKEAQAFNRKQEEFERQQQKFEAGEGPRPVEPTIPWEQMVDRVQSLQNIALDAVRDGTEIFFDSIKSATKSTRSLAKTWEKSREDVDTAPVLAGPVFEDPVEIKTRAGQQPDRVVWPIRHRGLTRLRIHAVLDPEPTEIQRPQSKRTGRERPPEEEKAPTLSNVKVSFEPAADTERYDDVTSLLTVEVGEIPSGQKVGVYEGLIRASNFELLIARLRIHVLEAATDERARARKTSGASHIDADAVRKKAVDTMPRDARQTNEDPSESKG